MLVCTSEPHFSLLIIEDKDRKKGEKLGMYMDSKLSTISLELDKVRLDSVSEYVKESDSRLNEKSL